MKTFTKSALFLLWLIPMSFFAQSTVTGKVTDAGNGQPIPGVNIIVRGTTNGTTTDFDGIYSFNNVNNGDVLIFSYLGFISQELAYSGQATLDVILEEDAAQLEQVVLIGYGSTRKKDLTGAVDLLTSEDLNQGAITTADQLLNGRSAGVRVVTSGGEPDAAANIRIRGGSSLNANNSPLIVIDGVPISNNNPAGQANVLGLVNPNDIESFSILKDASATAIYGSRASNGVIIIKTKTGTSGEAKFEFNSNVQIGTLTDKLDVLSSSEFVSFITTNYPDQTDLLGVNGVIYDTDWQEEIYRTSFTKDNNFTARANLFGKIPFRASIGYTDTEGILKESNVERYSGSISARPNFFNNTLKLTVNAKGILSRKNQPDQGAIGDALQLNPTLPVFDPTGNDFFGGFFQTTNPNTVDIITTGPTNALAKLKQRQRNEDSDRLIGNFEVDYSLPFVSGLRAIVNLGLDYSESDIEQFDGDNTIQAYNNFQGNTRFISGKTYDEVQLRRDQTLEAYLSYTKDFGDFINRLDMQGGYAYQNFYNEGIQERIIAGTDGNPTPGSNFTYVNKLNLQSFFGRINLNILDKYLITGSLRTDGSSLFRGTENQWGYFPAAAIAWKLNEENFLRNSKVFTDLKIRGGYGITGQQDITGAVGYYPSSPLYIAGNEDVQYLFGNQFFTTYRAGGYNPNLTWEKTATINAGIDYNLWNGLVSGTVDYYKRTTTDLLALVPQPEGSLVTPFIDNVGETDSEGVEIALNLQPVNTKNTSLSFNGNISFNETYVTDLGSTSFIEIPSGIGRGTGINVARYVVGGRSRNFWVYEQVYDVNGNPIQDAFVDQNGDNVIDNNDRIDIPFDPKWTYGFGANFTYKKIDFSANFRGQLGGKIYDANRLNRGYADYTIPVNGVGFINNVLDLNDANGNYTGFTENPSGLQAFSDFYISDATFLRLDNITLGYDLSEFFNSEFNLRIYGSANNVFVITDYEGLDPENFGGIETSPYARPRTYTFGVNVNF